MPPASRPVSRSAAPARRDLDARPGGARAGRSPRLTRQRERVAAGKDAERVARRRHTGDRAAVLAERAEVLDADRRDGRAGVELADQREAGGRPAERLWKQPQAGAGGRARQGGGTGDRENDGGVESRIGRGQPYFQVARSRDGHIVPAAAQSDSDHAGEQRHTEETFHRPPPFRCNGCRAAALSGAPVALTHARKSPMSNPPLLLPRKSRYRI